MKSPFFKAVALSVLLLNACSSTGGSYTLGAIGPLTGDASAYGVEFQRAVELATQDINAEWASTGQTLSFEWEDGMCNGKDASTAAQKLVDIDSVNIILGAFCSSETLAAAEITQPAGVLLFSPGSSSPAITDAGDLVYRNWPSDAFQGTKLAEMAYDSGYKTVAMISEEQDYTKGISGSFTAKFEELGGTVIEEMYLSEDTDFKTQLTKLSGAAPDIYFVNPQTPAKADVIFKQMEDMGLKGPFLLNDAAGTSTDILTTYKDFLEGSYTATPYVDEQNADAIALKTRYEESYGESVQYLGYFLTAYDATWILANGIAANGSDDPAAMKSYLDALSYTGLAGIVSFDENGDPETGHSIYKVVDGTIIKVD
jgi:branched-chain amino acid transport system substrate-binding protein